MHRQARKREMLKQRVQIKDRRPKHHVELDIIETRMRKYAQEVPDSPRILANHCQAPATVAEGCSVSVGISGHHYSWGEVKGSGSGVARKK